MGKSHGGSYPCPLNLNYFWNLGFLLGVTILLQMITGILLSLHYTPDINSAYYSVMHIVREIYYGWCLRFIHSSGASFVFLVLFIHVARVITNLLSPFPCLIEWVCGGHYVYNPTLKRFFLFHFCLPFLVLGFVVLHFFYLHFLSSNNPLRLN